MQKLSNFLERPKLPATALASEPAFVPVCIFFFALLVRIVFAWLHPDLDGFLAVRGKPTSDGVSWTLKAASLATGGGIPHAQQPGLRPFYSMVLSCFYTWFGFSLLTVTVLNIVISALAAPFIYLCGIAIRRDVALWASLFFCLDPTQLIQIPQAGTEPLGLLFFVLSVYFLLRAIESGNGLSYFLTGLCIGLSNLTRPLTLFAVPFYALLIAGFDWSKLRNIRYPSRSIILILVGAGLVISPWLVRQKLTYGIWSLSDNIGEALYCSTSPNYKRWTPRVREEADRENVPNTVGDRYRYFMRGSFENLQKYPIFALRNCVWACRNYLNSFSWRSRSNAAYAEELSRAGLSQRVYLNCSVVFLIVFGALYWRRYRWRSGLAFTVSAGLLLLGYSYLPASLTFVLLLTGVIFAFWRGRRIHVAILAGSLVFTVLGSAIFANPILFRSIIMTDWLFTYFHAAAIYLPAEGFAMLFASKLLLASDTRHAGNQSRAFNTLFIAVARKIGLLSLGLTSLFFVISGVRLLWLNFGVRAKQKPLPSLSLERRMDVLQNLSDIDSEIQTSLVPPTRIFSSWGAYNSARVGQVVVEVQRYDYFYYFPPCTSNSRAEMFAWRPFGRSAVIVSPFNFIIPGRIPCNLIGRPVVMVGVIEKEARQSQDHRLQVRGIAVILLDEKGQLDYRHLIMAAPDPLLTTFMAPH